ncbi:MAG: protoporphyrinogen oxidase [Myxococcota bacterium]|nr:protoporphyrinogen oxidase [Myxococcota bacterium]
MARIAIVGGGISGLCTALALSEHEVTVLEAGPRLGGKLHSEHVDGAVLEAAANGLLNAEPSVGRLVERLKLESQVILATEGERYVFFQGRMQAIPTSPPTLLTKGFLSLCGRLRLLTEPFRTCGPADEPIAEFTRRRLGNEVLQKLVTPMVTGIHAGDPEQLSMSACFPKLKKLEQEHGSLLAGLRKQASIESPGQLMSFQGGLSTLIEALHRELEHTVVLNAPCRELQKSGSRWQLNWGEASGTFDIVVLACGAEASSRLIEPLSPDVTRAFRDIPTAAVGVVAMVLPTENWTPPSGFGCLVPDLERSPPILGALFTSNIFPSHAPEGTAVMRIILGGTRDPQALNASDEALLTRAQAGLESLLGKLPPPTATRVHRYPKAIPQYTMGHLERVHSVRALEAQEHGLFFTGNHLDGVAVKDCIRSAEETANRVKQELSR